MCRSIALLFRNASASQTKFAEFGKFADTLRGMSFAEYLKRLKGPRLSQNALAEYIGASSGAMSRWMTGQETPRPAYCRKLAKYFKVPEEEVLRAAGHLSPDPSAMTNQAPEGVPLDQLPVGDLLEAIEDMVPVPYLGEASAGPGTWNEPVTYLPKGVLGRRRFVTRTLVRGDCMAPDIRDGETVLVDMAAEWRDGDIVAATIGNEVVIKRFKKEGDAYFLVPNEGEPIPVVDGVLIQGVVFGKFMLF